VEEKKRNLSDYFCGGKKEIRVTMGLKDVIALSCHNLVTDWGVKLLFPFFAKII